MLQTESPPLRTVLIGHYANDRLTSMERFDRRLEQQLRELGATHVSWRPPICFGRLIRGATGCGKWLGYLDKFLLFPLQIRFRLWRMGDAARSTLFILPDHSHGPYVPLFRELPHIVHVHDLIAIRTGFGEFPGQQLSVTGRLYQRCIVRGLRKGRNFLCISKASRQDLQRLIRPDAASCEVVWNELNYPYERSAPEASRPRELPELQEGGFLLHVGNRLWYKNRPGVLRIFKATVERMPPTQPLQLVIVGDPPGSEDIEALENAGLRSRVHFLQGIECPVLQWLYSRAAGLLFPSFYEGFGWPIIEALACGCPVLTTRRPPMSEIGSDVVDYLEPLPMIAASEDEQRWLQSAADAVQRWFEPDSPSKQADMNRRIAHSKRFAVGTAFLRYLKAYRDLLPCNSRPR